mmetsp:Transcript_13344/g.19957  ORF Transcript_13344/g.19957 Transcript_13344/m.19957 type:complete len:93 (-) Transcript_13344:112-390(-)
MKEIRKIEEKLGYNEEEQLLGARRRIKSDMKKLFKAGETAAGYVAKRLSRPSKSSKKEDVKDLGAREPSSTVGYRNGSTVRESSDLKERTAK